MCDSAFPQDTLAYSAFSPVATTKCAFALGCKKFPDQEGRYLIQVSIQNIVHLFFDRLAKSNLVVGVNSPEE